MLKKNFIFLQYLFKVRCCKYIQKQQSEHFINVLYIFVNML